MYKVPFRDIYCDTLRSWIQETIWCHVILKVFKSDIDSYREPPEFYEKLGFSVPKDIDGN